MSRVDPNRRPGPFGELLTARGEYAAENPYRFSTKYVDAETGLHYYGYRYYNSSTGQWLSRDPIGEEGGLNLYGFVHNNAIDAHDNLGLCDANCNPPLNPKDNEYNKQLVAIRHTYPHAHPKKLDAFEDLVDGIAIVKTIEGCGSTVGSAAQGATSLTKTALNSNAKSETDLTDHTKQMIRKLVEDLKGKHGYSVWLVVKYEKCEPCGSRFFRWLAECQPYEWRTKYKAVKCRKGSWGNRGKWGLPDGGRPHISVPNISECIRDEMG